jgi:hypothetical protein
VSLSILLRTFRNSILQLLGLLMRWITPIVSCNGCQLMERSAD